MNTKKLGLFIVAVLMISVSQAQVSERGNMRPQRDFQKENLNKQRHGDRPAANFLSEEQKEKAKALRLESAKKMKPIMNELNELKAKQRTLTTSDNPDLNAIYANIDAISAKQAEIAKIKAAQNQKMRKMLDEEQLLKYDMMHQRKHKKGKGNTPPGRG